ncbi:GapS6a family protein [Piscirickettsia litoralis]|uniref:Uncharacterized protein n=1 Tax=Piscirickettsia litoralis TaxID=1891921 RepID=A0ABX2ZX46_9GAMM|nr:hypothetical protein [Piscirickettsia litoralis]ODN41179.1 hypothetical protein BGC07_17710 [Piscirickettsia litoralis]
MDFVTTTILSGCIYDLFKKSLEIGKEKLKQSLKEYVLTDEIATQLSNELNKLDLNSDMSELAIDKKLKSSQDIINMLSSIPRQNVTHTVNQAHYGIGNNINGDINISHG